VKPDREAYLRRVSAPSGPWVQLTGAMLREVFAEVDALRAEIAGLQAKHRKCIDCGAWSKYALRCEPCWGKAQEDAIVIDADAMCRGAK